MSWLDGSLRDHRGTNRRTHWRDRDRLAAPDLSGTGLRTKLRRLAWSVPIEATGRYWKLSSMSFALVALIGVPLFIWLLNQNWGPLHPHSPFMQWLGSNATSNVMFGLCLALAFYVGVRAMSQQPDTVVQAALSERRCPCCVNPLPDDPDADGLYVCTTCEAAWKPLLTPAKADA